MGDNLTDLEFECIRHAIVKEYGTMALTDGSTAGLAFSKLKKMREPAKKTKSPRFDPAQHILVCIGLMQLGSTVREMKNRLGISYRNVRTCLKYAHDFYPQEYIRWARNAANRPGVGRHVKGIDIPKWEQGAEETI